MRWRSKSPRGKTGAARMIEADETDILALGSLMSASTPEDRAAAIRVHLGEEAYRKVLEIRRRRVCTQAGARTDER